MWPGVPDPYQNLPESDSGSFWYTRSRDYQTPTRHALLGHRKRTFRLDRRDYNQLREFLNINWVDFLKVSDNSVDDMWEKFKLIMYDGIKQFIHSHN